MDTIYNALNLVPPWAYIAVGMVFFVLLPTVGVLTLLERKVASWAQDRVGPNRATFGFNLVPEKYRFKLPILQVAADGLKFFVKEDFRAKNVDRVLFSLGPALMLVIVMVAVAIVPWAGTKGTRSTVTLDKGQVPTEAIAAALPKWHELIGTPAIKPLEALPPVTEPQGRPERVQFDGEPPLPPLPTVSPESRLRADEPLPVRSEITYTHGWRFQVAGLDIGVLFAVSILSLAVYGVVIGGWASNNKYSFLGGLRATANMISYEIPLGLSILAVIVLYGTLDLGVIVEKQTHYWLGVIPAWNIFAMPVVFVLFLTCMHAESNRAPFDIAEAEQELVGGYHTEYSSMRFALFFLAEYFEMLVTSSIAVALFFGGWHVPYLDKIWPAFAGSVDARHPSVTESWLVLAVQWAAFYTKVLVLIFVFMWTRWSLPRFKFDQILTIAWQGLIPMSIALLAVSTLAVWGFAVAGVTEGSVLPGRVALAILVGNVVVGVGAITLNRIFGPQPQDKPNKRLAIAGSRFTRSPIPAWAARPATDN